MEVFALHLRGRLAASERGALRPEFDVILAQRPVGGEGEGGRGAVGGTRRHRTARRRPPTPPPRPRRPRTRSILGPSCERELNIVREVAS